MYIGGSYYRVFDKLDNGLFYGESAYIFGNDVIIVTHIENTFYFLFKYETIKNPNMNEDASFPQSDPNLPPNVLYSPLISTLKRGKSYSFKIKCKSARQLFVFDGNNIFELTKNNDIFSYQLTISNDASYFSIVGYILDSKEMSLFYLYELS